MLAGLGWIFWRVCQILTLIPTLGMLAYFVNGFTKANELTPAYILTLFIVSVLACAWAVATLIRYSSTKRSAHFVAFVDLLFVGAFIAAVYELRAITNENCAHFSTGSFYVSLGIFGYSGYVSGSDFALHIDKTCAMLKAAFAFGIMNCIFFFFTFVLGLFLHKYHREVVYKETRTRRRSTSHGSRRGHSSSGRSHRSSSRHRYYV